MFRLCIAIISISLVGCGGKSSTPVPSSTDHSSHGKKNEEADKHAGHSGMAGMNDMPMPASLKMDAGWDNLKPGVAKTLTFHLERDGKTVKEFDLLHERVMHFIVVRDALDEFQHLHPKMSENGIASVEVAFPTAGKYLIFVDCQPKGEAQQTVRHEMSIEGAPPLAPELQIDVPGTITVGDCKADVALQRSDNEWNMTFALSDLEDQQLKDLEPYLGAMGHLVVIKSGTGEYVHAHAETQTAPDGRVAFATHFTHPGIYKAWGQFQRNAQVFTIPAVLKVD